MIPERFEIIQEDRRTPRAASYRARDREADLIVSLDERIVDLADWDAVAFDERGRRLCELDHPSVPRVKAVLATPTDQSVHLYVAQVCADGPSVASLVDEGKRWSEPDARRDLRNVLESLAYLHGFAPPLSYGGVTPRNLVRQADGSMALTNIRADTTAEPLDDVYALGALVVYMLCGTKPSDLPVEGNRLAFAPLLADISPELVALLERMTSPFPGERYDAAGPALAALMAIDASAEEGPNIQDTAPLEAPPASSIQDTAPLEAPSTVTQPTDLLSTAPLVAPKPVPRLAETAPLAAPKPVERLAETAPLAAPKPVDAPAPAAIAVPPAPAAAEAAVLYYRRTKNFPRWTTVEPLEQGEFFIATELHDVDEKRLAIEIRDLLERLELKAWVNRGKAAAARKKRLLTILAGGGAGALLLFVVYTPLMPLAVVGTLAAAGLFLMKHDDGDEPPTMELVITPDELTISRNSQVQLRTAPASVRWSLRQTTELFLTADRDVPVLLLSRQERMQANWFEQYVEARCTEIASRRVFVGTAAPVATAAPAFVAAAADTAEVSPIAHPAHRPAAQTSAADTAEVSPLAHPANRPPAPAPDTVEAAAPGPSPARSLAIGAEMGDVATEQVVLSHLTGATPAVPAEETQQVSLSEVSQPELDKPALSEHPTEEVSLATLAKSGPSDPH